MGSGVGDLFHAPLMQELSPSSQGQPCETSGPKQAEPCVPEVMSDAEARTCEQEERRRGGRRGSASALPVGAHAAGDARDSGGAFDEDQGWGHVHHQGRAQHPRMTAEGGP